MICFFPPLQIVSQETTSKIIKGLNRKVHLWGTTGNFPGHGEILKYPVGIKFKLKHWNISSFKNYPLKKRFS